MKNITFSAEENLIRRARKRAARKNTTLNEEFRRWLSQYVEEPASSADFYALMAQLNHVEAGRKFTRDEMNER